MMIVWASRSQTFDPSSVDQLVDSVADANAKEMRKQGLLRATT